MSACLTGTGHGAAPCRTCRNDAVSYLARTSSGSEISRWNIVGTMWVWVILCWSIRRSASSASHRSMSTTPTPKASGAARRERQRRRVVQRPGAQVQVGAPLLVPPEVDRGLCRRGRGGDRRSVDALRPTGRARRVEHLAAGRRVVDVVAGLGVDGGVVGVETVLMVRSAGAAGSAHGRLLAGAPDADGESHGALRCQRSGFLGDVQQRRVGDEGLGLAVVDDVARFLTGEVPVDRRQPEPGAQASGPRLDERGPVRAHQGHGVAVAEPAARSARTTLLVLALSSANVRSPWG